MIYQHEELVPSRFIGYKLEKFLSISNTQISYNSKHKLLRKGKIRVNNKRIKFNYTLCQGDIIQYAIPCKYSHTNNHNLKKKVILNSYGEQTLNLILSNILYENESILAINKPSGLATQGGQGINLSIDMLLPFLAKELNLKVDRLRLVHRLDKQTSGVILLAKTIEASKYLFHQFSMRKVIKQYHCLSLNQSNLSLKKTGIIVSDIIYNNKIKTAETHYKVIKSKGNIIYLEVFPKTGRKHQIRNHLATQLMLPIIGDYKYGFNYKIAIKNNPKLTLNKDEIFLHSHNIKYTDESHNLISISAPDREEWTELI